MDVVALKETFTEPFVEEVTDPNSTAFQTLANRFVEITFKPHTKNTQTQ